MKRLSIRLALVIVAALVLFVVPSVVSFYTDWLWFGDVGYRQVFSKELATKGFLLVAVFAASFAWLYANLLVALGSMRNLRAVRFQTREGIEIAMPGREEIRRLILGVAGILAVILGLVASGQWLTWLSYRNGVAFGDVDPILHRDIAYYVFTLPFLEAVRGLMLLLVVVAALGSGAIYVLSRALGFSQFGGLTLSSAAQRHLSILAAIFFALLAWGALLQIPQTLTTASGIIYGAGYSDVFARFPAARVLAVTATISAVIALWHGFSNQRWLLPAAVALYVLALGGGQAYAAFVQRFSVGPNEQVRESPYIVHNIASTRRAFALDGVDEQELTGDASLSRADIAANATTLRNVRLWDHQPLLDTFGQIQEIRTYYDFVSVDNDRYTINGEYRQIMLSARELSSSSLPNRNWINERLTFTHGYGLTLGPVNQVTDEGLPVLFIKDLPPQSSVDLKIDQPSIYFGELSNDYVFVRTRDGEFDYPKGDDNVKTTYSGSTGVPIGSFTRRLLYSISLRSLKLLLSQNITPESRILMTRNVRERVETIAPFLTFDSDPYIVIAGGRLFWLLDAYTLTDRYPYSTPAARGVNYIRNSVKVVIDAYDGTTTFYLADAKDPIARTYAAIFPGVFQPLADMPDAIRQHVRYPEDIFSIQSSMYSTYHMTNPAVFYNKEDEWEVPSLAEEDRGGVPLSPYYMIMKLPGQTNAAEFIQILPFTPRRKDNLSAWMVARSDGEHYGKLVVFRFPKQKVVFGPRQVVARINQDQTISPQITLWNQQGSQVIQGTLLVIPIEKSLLYIRPLYLRGTTGKIPELKRVIVAYQGQIVMEDNLDAALDRLFGAGALGPGAQTGTRTPLTAAAPPVPGNAVPPTDLPGPGQDGFARLAEQAREHYQRALQAQRDGNWALYGEEIKQLGQVLEELRTKN